MALSSRRAYAPFIQACRDYHRHHMNQIPRLFSSAVKVTTHTNTNDKKQFSRLENLRTQLIQEDSSLHEFASTTKPTIGNIKRKKAPPRPAKILPVSILISNTTISFCCNRISDSYHLLSYIILHDNIILYYNIETKMVKGSACNISKV